MLHSTYSNTNEELKPLKAMAIVYSVPCQEFCVEIRIITALYAGYLLHFLRLTKQYYRNSTIRCPLSSILKQWNWTGYGGQTWNYMLLLLFGKYQSMCALKIQTIPSSYFWIVFKPIDDSELTCTEECQQLPCPPGVLHFELFHAWRCHYNVVIGPDNYLSTTTSRF